MRRYLAIAAVLLLIPAASAWGQVWPFMGVSGNRPLCSGCVTPGCDTWGADTLCYDAETSNAVVWTDLIDAADGAVSKPAYIGSSPCVTVGGGSGININITNPADTKVITYWDNGANILTRRLHSFYVRINSVTMADSEEFSIYQTDTSINGTGTCFVFKVYRAAGVYYFKIYHYNGHGWVSWNSDNTITTGIWYRINIDYIKGTVDGLSWKINGVAQTGQPGDTGAADIDDTGDRNWRYLYIGDYGFLTTEAGDAINYDVYGIKIDDDTEPTICQ